MAGRENGVAAVAGVFGVLLVWSAIKGWSLLGTIQDVVAGKKPAGTTRTGTPISAPAGPAGGSSGTPGAAATGSQIADRFMQYQGHLYKYGGFPGRAGTDPWDCSSAVNWVVSHDLGLPWPGSGRYDGTSHGPPTGSWAAWLLAHGGGSTTVKRAQVQAGDIIVWAGHMGIATSNTQMISAENPTYGTLVGAIDGGGAGPVLVYGRLAGA